MKADLCAYCGGNVTNGFCASCGAAAGGVMAPAKILSRQVPEHFEITTRCEECRTVFAFTEANVESLGSRLEQGWNTVRHGVTGWVQCPVCGRGASHLIWMEPAPAQSPLQEWLNDPALYYYVVVAFAILFVILTVLTDLFS